MEINYQDQFNRKFRYLRISLTQACNFSCVYCVPQGLKLKAAQNELSAKEFFLLAQLLVEVAGIQKIRLTGGEPLLSKHFSPLLLLLNDLDLQSISLTSNGIALGKKIEFLKENGIKTINISLDSINPQLFCKMSRGGQFYTVQQNIDKALEAGLKIKINAVPMKRYNYEEILPLLDFCLQRNIECRFIELMNMGQNVFEFDKEFISLNEILNVIKKKYQFQPVQTHASSTSLKYEIKNKGYFGIISNYSQPFCSTCDRLRLSSTGDIYGCISTTTSFSMKNLLNMPKNEAHAALKSILFDAMKTKRSAFTGTSTFMQTIGG